MEDNQKIILRPVEQKDEKFIFECENDSDLWIYSGATKTYTTEEIKQYVSKPQNLNNDGQERFMIEFDTSLIGCIDLFNYDPLTLSVSVGILIIDRYRNNGLASKSLKALESKIRNEFNIKSLLANVLINNKASIYLFKNNGFSELKQSEYSYQNQTYIQYELIKKLN